MLRCGWPRAPMPSPLRGTQSSRESIATMTTLSSDIRQLCGDALQAASPIQTRRSLLLLLSLLLLCIVVMQVEAEVGIRFCAGDFDRHLNPVAVLAEESVDRL